MDKCSWKRLIRGGNYFLSKQKLSQDLNHLTMKLFLHTCTAAMVAAGIFGTADLVNDLQKGTMIEYDKEDPFKVVAAPPNSAVVIPLKKDADEVQQEAQAEVENPPVINVSDLDFDDFSRGEPVEYQEEVVIPEEDQELPAEAKKARLENVAEATESAEAKVEGPKLDYKLFSRGKPPRLKDEIVLADTAQKE
jgi:hypothetical protein